MIRILVDTPALNSATGSGIRTYALNVLRAQGMAGFRSHLLYDIPFQKDANLNELYAGQFAHDKLPGFLQFARHAVKTLAGFSTRPRQLERNPRLVWQVRNSPEYRWQASLPSQTSKDIYKLAYDSHSFHGGFTAMANPDGKLDLWHATFQRPLFLRRAKNIVSIHDLIPLRLPDTNPELKKEWYQLVLDSCKKADHILATSNHTKNDIVEFLRIPEEKISVVYQPPDPMVDVSEEDSALCLQALDLEPQGYFLFIGNIEPRKNIKRMIRAWLGIPDRPPLVIAGHKAWLWEEELSNIPAGADVRFPGYISLQEKSTLYRNALCLLFPSLYEGFGLPPLEAMSAGLPVITSSNSSLSEVCGDAALYVDPHDVKEISSAMQRIRGNPALRSSLAEKGLQQAARFSLEHFSAQLKTTYEDVLGSSGRVTAKAPSRLAVVTLAVGDKAQKLLSISRPRLKAYAKKLKADYHEISEPSSSKQDHNIFFSKLKVRDFLDRYDRVLYVDSDILISQETPDIFETVPESHFGACLEKPMAFDPIAVGKSVLGDLPGWTSGYFNAGLMVISQAHKPLFDINSEEVQTLGEKEKIWDDQIYFNWKLRQLGIPLFALDTHYNWTPGHAEIAGERVPDPNAWMVHFCSEGFEYTRRDDDDHYTAKFHQMICWDEHLKNRQIKRFHPNRFYTDKGRLDRNYYPIRMASGEALEGERVCYGPYSAMEDGYYRFSVKPSFSQNSGSPSFRVALCAERGKRWLFETQVSTDPETQSFCLYLNNVDDLEVCFYGAGTPYLFEYVEVEKLS